MQAKSNRTDCALIERKDDKRTAAVAKHVADRGGFATIYDATNVARIEKSVTPSSPETVMLMHTYGEETIVRHFTLSMKAMVSRIGETNIDAWETDNMAKAILSTDYGRILPYECVLGFIQAIECGEYTLYGGKPRNIMEAWHDYSKNAKYRYDRMVDDHERKRMDEERKQWSANALKGEELARMKDAWKRQYDELTNNN